jgi:rubrerythrin
MADSPKQYSFQELSALEQLNTDAMCSLYNLELIGEAFYNALATKLPDAAAELVRRNAVEEAGHARRVQRALTILTGSEFAPTPEMLAVPEMQAPEVVTAELLQMMIAGEIAGDAGYQRWADNEANEEVARLLRLNGREESIHGGRLQAALELL